MPIAAGTLGASTRADPGVCSVCRLERSSRPARGSAPTVRSAHQMTSVAQPTIQRTTYYSDRLRAHDVRIDHTSVGTLRGGESMTLSVPEGRHRMQVHIDWCTSNQIEFVAPAGASLAFACGSRLSGWRALAAVFVVAFRPGDYLWLREAQQCPECRWLRSPSPGTPCRTCGAPRPVRTT